MLANLIEWKRFKLDQKYYVWLIVQTTTKKKKSTDEMIYC